MKLITSFSTLMRLAPELGQARLSNDKERIAKAKKEHDAYVALVVKSTETLH
jgi:hypothetical protein